MSRFDQVRAASALMIPVILYLLILAGCDTLPGKAKKSLEDDLVVATVDGENISMSDLKREILEVRGFSATLDVDMATRPETIKALQRSIRKALILEEAKRRGVTVTGREINEEIEDIKKDYPEGSFNKLLIKEGIDEKVWREKVGKTLLIRKGSELIKDEAKGVTPGELNKYMRNNRIYLGRKVTVPRKWHLLEYVFLSREDAEKGRELLSTSDGKRDEEIIERAGLKASVYDLGLLTKREIGTGYVKDVTSLSESELSVVIKLPSSYAFFRVMKIVEKHSMKKEEARREVIRKIYMQKKEEHLSRWLQERFNGAAIRINEAALGRLEKRVGAEK